MIPMFVATLLTLLGLTALAEPVHKSGVDNRGEACALTILEQREGPEWLVELQFAGEPPAVLTVTQAQTPDALYGRDAEKRKSTALVFARPPHAPENLSFAMFEDRHSASGLLQVRCVF